MTNNRWVMILALAAAGLPVATAQSTRPQDDATAFQAPPSKSAGSKDKVTTDDTALKPGDQGNSDKKSKQSKNRKAPKSPPNPPVADPREDPSSPVNQPKTPAGAPAPK